MTIAYRKRLVDSPAYRLNHEEVVKALEEGIVFAENLNPIEAVPDARGALSAMVFKREGRQARGRWAGGRDGLITLPARTALVAAGTSPNITYEKECPDTFTLDAKKKFFQPHSVSANGDGGFHLVARSRTASSRPTTSGGRFVSYYGDNHRGTPATSSRRWRRRSTGFRTSARCSRASLRRSIRTARAIATRRGRGWSRGSTRS